MSKTITENNGKRTMPKKDYTRQHNFLLDLLTVYEYKLHSLLVDHADNETQECWPHQETLARRMMCSLRLVKMLLKRLEDLHLVAIQPTLKGNRYTLLRVDKAALRERIEATKAPPTESAPYALSKVHHVHSAGAPYAPLKELDPRTRPIEPDGAKPNCARSTRESARSTEAIAELLPPKIQPHRSDSPPLDPLAATMANLQRSNADLTEEQCEARVIAFRERNKSFSATAMPQGRKGDRYVN